MKPNKSNIYEVKRPSKSEYVQLVNEFFNLKEVKDELGWFTYIETLQRAFQRSDRRLFYIEQGQNITGALMVWCKSNVLKKEEAQIRLVAVHPDHRRRGIGSTLCRNAENFARSHGQSEMVADVSSRQPVIAFWGSIGYSRKDSWLTDNGKEMVRVSRSL